MAKRLSGPAARKKCHKPPISVEPVPAKKFLPAEPGLHPDRQRVSYISGIHTPFTEPWLFERKQTEQPPYPFTYLANPALAPRPYLRCNKIIDGYPQALQVTCQ